jgi:Circularly permutated YpsA SLOG family
MQDVRQTNGIALDNSGLARKHIIMIIISGGQTRADQAGWRAAKVCGLPTRGWMPKGFVTEDGPRPEFADQYVAEEMPTDSE